jgi:hypothetical protein
MLGLQNSIGDDVGLRQKEVLEQTPTHVIFPYEKQKQ